MTIQNYGVSYDELEPHYDRFEKFCGISGRAGRLSRRLGDGVGTITHGWKVFRRAHIRGVW